MNAMRCAVHGLAIVLSAVAAGCATGPGNTSNSGSPSPSASLAVAGKDSPITLPVLDALFSDEAFKTELKSKLQLLD